MKSRLVWFAKLRALSSIFIVSFVLSTSSAAVAATATDLAIAMGVPPTSILSATLGTSDSAAADVISSPLGTNFPTEGTSFALLATGLASSASTPNDAEDTSTELAGLNNEQGNDLVQLSLRLAKPSTATCLAFDVAFLSEEFPEYVGSQFNDAFTAEIGGTDLSIENDQIVAPKNFAFDSEGNLLTINTVFGVTSNTGTTYDSATPLLRATTRLEPLLLGACQNGPTPGANCTSSNDCGTGGQCVVAVEIVLSVQDLGDSIYDSAAFLDNFAWLYSPDCAEGLFVDSDGDALLDVWETDGIDVDADGTIDVDLPGMGASPQHKDLFVEADYMVLPAKSCSANSASAGARCQVDSDCNGGTCTANDSPHSHKPNLDALRILIDAFANAPVDNPDQTKGIRLHIDAGADSVMNPVTGALWAEKSQSNELVHKNNLGTGTLAAYSWDAFDVIKRGDGVSPENFSIKRGDVFHYVVFAHNLAPAFTTTSGISRLAPASDFIVSLGGWTNKVGTVQEQAGTLMHEFGHNLGLLHGGNDDFNYKSNYLSVMNYSFQTRGLHKGGLDGKFDFSFVDLPDLNETSLNENVGLNGGATIAEYGTRYSCGIALAAAAAAGAQSITLSATAALPAATYTNINALTRNDLQLQINKDTDTAEYIAWSGTTGTTLNGVVTCTTATCIQGLHFAHAAGEQLTGERLVSNANAAIDWNCNDVATQNPLSSDINRDNLKITLSSFNDWESLVFDGGAVGKLGEQVDLPASTPVDEIDKQTDEGNPTPFAVSIGSPSDLDVVVGASRTVVFEIVNEGDETDTYDLSATSSLGWAHIGHLDSPLSLGSGARREISIVVTVPPGTPEGTKDELTLTAQSQGNPNLLDSATTATTAFAPSLEELIEVIGKLGLPKGITQSLIAKLKPSAKDPSAANRLGAFINEVKAQRGKAIPTEVADELIVAATALL